MERKEWMPMNFTQQSTTLDATEDPVDVKRNARANKVPTSLDICNQLVQGGGFSRLGFNETEGT